MLHAILNKSWKQHSTKQQLYSHLTLISQTIQVRWARIAGHYERSKDELISDILQWIPTQGHTANIRCHPKDMWCAVGKDSDRESSESILSAYLDDDDDYHDIRWPTHTIQYLLILLENNTAKIPELNQHLISICQVRDKEKKNK